MAYFFVLPKTESLKSSFCIRPLWILNCELFVVNLSVYYRRWKRLHLVTVGRNDLRSRTIISKHSEGVPHLQHWATAFRVENIRSIPVRRSYGCCGYWEVTLSASFRILSCAYLRINIFQLWNCHSIVNSELWIVRSEFIPNRLLGWLFSWLLS